MGLFEHWPYVNFHDLNLDWVIKEIPKVFASRDEAQASAEASAESAAASQLSANASQASAEASAESAQLSQDNAAAAAESASDASEIVSDTRNQIAMLQSRVDNIIPDGTQTEGNTELIDIRVAYNGQIYDSAGNSVRGQVTDLLDASSNIYQTYIYNNMATPKTGTIAYTNSGTIMISDDNININLEAGKTYLGYALLTISDLTGYTTGNVRLQLLGTLSGNLNDKYAGTSQNPFRNGKIELYGTFTPASNGWVKVRLYSNNMAAGTQLTCNVVVDKLYVFEADTSIVPVIQKNDYDPEKLIYAEMNDGVVGFDSLDEDLQNMISNADTNIIDCWGDSLTAGAGSSTDTYPSKLQEYVGSDYVVNNYGQGSECAESIAFRQGGLSAIVQPFTSSTNYVQVPSLTSIDGKTLSDLSYQGTYLGNNVVTINGTNFFYRRVNSTTCQLARISGSSQTYTRPMYIKAEGKGIHHISIFCLGQNGWINDDPYQLADIIQNMVKHNDYDKYIVVAEPTGNAASKQTEETILAAMFGDHFVNAREYISEYGCADNEITPTPEDVAATSAGAIPPSLKADGTHLNDSGYTAMAKCIYERGVSLGYWQ